MLVLVTALVGLGVAGCAQPDASSGTASQAGVKETATGRRAPTTTTEGNGDSSSPSSYKPLGRVPVTTSGGKMPPGCGAQQVVGLMTHLVAAFNKGDNTKLERLFPERASLMPWLYSTNRGSEVEFATDKRDALIEYFTERNAKNDQLRMVSIEIRPSNATSDGTAYADVSYSMNRRADDLRAASGPWHHAEGKSVVDCRGQVLAVTSLETRVQD